MVCTSVCDKTQLQQGLHAGCEIRSAGSNPAFRDQRDIGETMPDVAVAILAGDLRRERLVQGGGQRRGNLVDADALPAAEIQRPGRRPRSFSKAMT